MQKKIVNYIKAGYPGLYIVSHEEARVETEIKAAAQSVGFTLYGWSITRGLFDASNGATVDGAGDTADPFSMLQAFDKLGKRSIVIAEDMHALLRDPNPILVRKLRESLNEAKTANRFLVILGCELVLPPEVEKEIPVLEFDLPGRQALLAVAERIAQAGATQLPADTSALLDAASGLTTTEAENAFALSFIMAKKLCPDVVAKEKAATLKKNGILEIVETRSRFADIGGLENLKGWLTKRKNAFGAPAKAYGLPTPKGLLMVGIPGCGKSLTARATAGILGLPLLRLDAGKLFGSLVGESERNLRSAIQTAEAIAPCVLWIDEMEKGFAGSKSSGSTDGGTSARVFGSFIQWMQDKTAPVFVVATANDVSQLPPEMLRKGRFDEMFFVDLPTREERESIWAIQIAKYGRKPEEFDLTALANASNGWTGSEIEAVFCEALFAAFETDAEPSTLSIALSANELVPLSKTMATDLEALRKWAQGRARKASATSPQEERERKLAV